MLVGMNVPLLMLLWSAMEKGRVSECGVVDANGRESSVVVGCYLRQATRTDTTQRRDDLSSCRFVGESKHAHTKATVTDKVRWASRTFLYRQTHKSHVDEILILDWNFIPSEICVTVEKALLE